MKFDNTFELSLPVEQAWSLLLDVPRITPCVPGAELVEIESDHSYRGKVSVRLGPVTLSFSGRAVIDSINEADHKAHIKAQGTDAKGRGGANASIDFDLQPSSKGSKVTIVTDLNLSGSVAQYGRAAGIIRGVAAEFTRDFAAALESQLSERARSTNMVKPAVTSDAPQQTRAILGFSLFLRMIWAALRNAFIRRPAS